MRYPKPISNAWGWMLWDYVTISGSQSVADVRLWNGVRAYLAYRWGTNG